MNPHRLILLIADLGIPYCEKAKTAGKVRHLQDTLPFVSNHRGIEAISGNGGKGGITL